MASLVQVLPQNLKPADPRLPGNDPFPAWDRLMRALAVTRPQRYDRAQSYRDLILKRIKVG